MNTRKYFVVLLVLITAGHASAQNDSDPWLKRNWNNMVARFNIYFNATQKLNAGVASLADKHKDDFNEVIDVYPYGNKADAKSLKLPMEETMKKASKVIQNKPNSKWTDDAYFIIGQTQFFSGNYFSAKETFQFVNNSFTDEDIKATSQLWLMKAYLQQGKLDDAEAIYGLLKGLKYPSNEFNTHLNLSAGDLMVKQGKESIAISLLDQGLNNLKDRVLKYRTHFVLGQLYLKANDYKKANTHFVKVLRMNAPYEYVFHANLGMAKGSAENGGQGAQRTIKYLKRMLKDDKNIEYYDQIYFELAKLEFSSGNEEQGLAYMKKSASSSTTNSVQQTETYLFLADLYFKERNYTSAQAYYDSAVAVIPENYPDNEKIKSKHSVLSKLIENIETIRTQDSLLDLSKLDRDILDKQIKKIIEEEAEKARIAAEEEEIRKEQERMNALAGGRRPASGGSSIGSGSTWYFYDAAAIARGENEFRRRWGSRKHTDYWRFINQSLMQKSIEEGDNDDGNEQEENPETYVSSEDEEQEKALADVEDEKKKYYADIPFSATAKLVANKKIQQAFLNNGKIYFDDLKEFNKSMVNMDNLITRYPKTIYKPEALFYLSKASKELGNINNAIKYNKLVADEYPETAYNSVLNGKEIEEDNSDVEVIALYEDMYEAFQQDNQSKVQKIKKEIDKQYPGNSIQGKIDYLYALSIGKTEGKEAYIEELEIVKEAYFGTNTGERAAYTLRLLKNDEKSSSDGIYKTPKDEIHYYVVTAKTSNGNEGEIQLNNYNNQFYGSKNLQLKSLVFEDKQLYYIKQFASRKDVLEYHEQMKSSTAFLQNAGLSEYNYYPITEENFRTLVKTKKELDYIKFFYKNYN